MENVEVVFDGFVPVAQGGFFDGFFLEDVSGVLVCCEGRHYQIFLMDMGSISIF